jgi:hypothetical protein
MSAFSDWGLPPISVKDFTLPRPSESPHPDTFQYATDQLFGMTYVPSTGPPSIRYVLSDYGTEMVPEYDTDRVAELQAGHLTYQAFMYNRGELFRVLVAFGQLANGYVGEVQVMDKYKMYARLSRSVQAFWYQPCELKVPPFTRYDRFKEQFRWSDWNPDDSKTTDVLIHQCRIDSILVGSTYNEKMDTPGNRFYTRATLTNVIQLDKDISDLVFVCCQQTPEVQWAPNNLNPDPKALEQKCVPKKYDVLDVD